MPGDRWYYCDAARDDEVCFGPVSLSRLAELIRTEQLPYDVLVSPLPSPGPTWVEADTVEQILEAIPLDRERLVREYLAYGCRRRWCSGSCRRQSRWCARRSGEAGNDSARSAYPTV